MTVRLRFAPSPTGHLHIGGARTALFNYLFAKSQGGTFILRIEDTDAGRNVDHAAEEFANSLRWLGIEWDEGAFCGGSYGPYVCTERLDIYAQHVDVLRAKGLVYDCFCSEDELHAEREEALAEGKMPHYSGRCRDLTEDQREAFRREGRVSTVRFHVPDEETIAFMDLLRGELTFAPHSTGGDFVIIKSNGIPTYNFACTIDDHLMAITHVIRGEEHISNTPRQLFLYQAFGWQPPLFGHVALILGPDGKKLSKRDESIMQFIEQYMAQGYLPEALFNFLALLGWSPVGEHEIFSKAELISQFALDRVSKSGAFFDSAKLAWMNGHYLKERAAPDLLPLVRPLLRSYEQQRPESLDDAWILELISLYKEQVSSLAEIPEVAKTFLLREAPFEEEARTLLRAELSREVLTTFLEEARQLGEWSPVTIKSALQAVQSRTGRKGKDLFMPVRAGTTGQLHGRDLPRSLVLLGREWVLARLQKALAFADEVQ